MTTCESGKCTRHAVYHVVGKFIGTNHVAYERNFCPAHLSELSCGIVELIDKYDDAGTLHDYLDVEHAVL